jgi:hypothetical protein
MVDKSLFPETGSAIAGGARKSADGGRKFTLRDAQSGPWRCRERDDQTM